MKKLYEQMVACNCYTANTMAVIGGKWKIMILNHLLEKDHRFNELQRELKGITAHTLSNSLKELEDDHLVIRTDYKTTPPKTSYAISEKGRELKPVLEGIQTFGKKYPLQASLPKEQSQV